MTNHKGIPPQQMRLVRKTFCLSSIQVWLYLWEIAPYTREEVEKPLDEIVNEVGCSRDTVRKALKVIFDAKLFKIGISGRGDSRGTSYCAVENLYGLQRYPRHLSGNDDYSEFLQSEYWQEVKNAVLFRDNYECQHCGKTLNLHVHHLTYEHHGQERDYLEDLIILCKGCHIKLH